MAYNAFTDQVESTAIHGWNGSIIESPDVVVSSDGITITLSIEKIGGGDLTVIFSTGYYEWDTSPAATVTLTAGSDTSPTLNYIYFSESTKTLTASTVSFPVTEHAPIATVMCQSAASLQTNGAYKVHEWTDFVTDTTEQGHLVNVSFWIRQQNATWTSGVAPTLTITPNVGTPDNVIFTSTAGEVLQLNPHTFPAFTGTPDIYTINDSVTPYNIVTDLNALLTDSLGATMENSFFSLVIWGVASEDTGDCKLFVNLPSGTYANSNNLIADASRFTNFGIPVEYRGTGFLIAQLQLRQQTSSGGTWTEVATVDLRGLLPAITAGGSPLGQVEFPDNTFRIFDEGDNTKLIAFEVSGITTATTRTLTVQDADGTIALSGVANFGTGVTSNTAYAVLCGGTTSTNPIQSIASVGTSGQVLTSNGPAALPTFQALPASSISITGDTGGALVGNAFTFTGGTTGLSFGGAGSTETLTFAGITANGGTVSLATDATASTVDIGTGAGAKTVTLGSTNTTSTTTLQAGSGGVKLDTVAEGALVTSSTSVISTVTGTAGFVLTANTAGTAPSFQAAAGGSGGTVVTEYTSGSGTHNLDASAVSVYVICMGGGGGGGSGRSGTDQAAGGGGGGAAGVSVSTLTPVSFFGGAGAGVSYAVGAAGTGGASVSTATTDGNPGTAGGNTSFGYLVAGGGDFGEAGIDGTGTGGVNSSVLGANLINNATTSNGGNGDDGSPGTNGGDKWPGIIATGGGGASGYRASSTQNGGRGGNISDITGVILAGGTLGVAAGGAGGAGNAPSSTQFIGGTGGGGGAGGITAGVTTGGNGGNGASPGGGGGGGGGSESGSASGTGGAGGTGYLVITEYLG